LVYSKLESGYEYFHAFFMDKHWHNNCTRNEYCNMSFEDYMKLKNNLSPCYFTKKAIHRYEMWLENQKNIHMNNTFLTPPFSKKLIQYQRYYSQRESWMDKSCSLTFPPLPPKSITLMSGFERYIMRRNASVSEISAYKFERSQ
ncbi:14974_t:CDS:2, partial [Funneliformis mosseae]